MGTTSAWGYAALAAVIVGFAFGLWRQKTAPQRLAKRKAKLAAKRARLNNGVDAAESEKESE